MKKLILILAVAFFVGCSNNPKPADDGIPQVVKEKFTAAYPGVDSVKWEAEEGAYEAEFLFDKFETSVLFDSTGKVLETEIVILSDSLPVMALAYCSDSLAGQKISEASKITDAKGVISFEAEIDKADYIFDRTGNFIKKVIEKESNQDEDKD